MVVLTRYASQDEARAAVTRLLEAGVGADLVREEHPEESANPLTGSAAAHHLLRVYGVDETRARALLDLPEPAPETAAEQVPAEMGAARGDVTESGERVHSWFGGRVRLTTRQAVFMVLGYLVALIVIPLVFFLGTRTLLEEDVETPEIDVTTSVPATPDR